MYPIKRNIPEFTQEVYFKNMEPVTKEKIANCFNAAQETVIFKLLHHLLQRIPLTSDFESLERVQSMVHYGEDVYYCDIKIGKLILGGTKDKLKSFLAMKDIYVFFVPEEEFASTDESNL